MSSTVLDAESTVVNNSGKVLALLKLSVCLMQGFSALARITFGAG